MGSPSSLTSGSYAQQSSAGVSKSSTPRSQSWIPFLNPNGGSCPSVREARRYAERQQSKLVHHSPAPTDYRATRQETVDRITSLQQNGSIPNPHAQEAEQRGADDVGHQAAPALTVTNQPTASEAPRPQFGSSGLGWVLGYFQSKLSLPVAEALSPVIPASSENGACSVDDPDCDGAESQEAQASEEVKPQALPRPRNEFANFIQEINPDIFTVRMSPTMEKQQAHLKLEKMHVLVVLQDAGVKGRHELARLLRDHLKWSTSARPELRISCLTNFAVRMKDLNPAELCTPELAKANDKNLESWLELLTKLAQFGTDNDLVLPDEDLGKYSASDVQATLLPRWKQAMRNRPNGEAQVDQLAGEAARVTMSMDWNRMTQTLQSLDHTFNQLTGTLPKGRLTIDVIGIKEYQMGKKHLKDPLASLGRLVTVMEKLNLHSSEA